MDIIKTSNWLYELYGRQENLKIKATYEKKDTSANVKKQKKEA